MDRYQRVEKPRADSPIDANEIRITSQGRMRSYITYAMTLLQEKGADEIVFKAMGRAINKAVTMVELIKRRIAGLHQITYVGSTDITDTWEPLEEGLLPLETTRHVSMITITLSKKELDTAAIGYQTPLPEDQVRPSIVFEHEGEGSPRGRGRGMGNRGRGRGRARGNGYITAEYEDGGWDQQGGYPRGRGRGRNFRGRGRGGYNGPRMDAQDDIEGYNERPDNFRGRGRRGGYNGPRPVAHEDYGIYNEGSGNFRGRRGGYNGPRSDDHDGYNEGPGNFRGRGRRGGNNGPRSDDHDEFGGYNQEAPGRGRGLGRGPRGRGGRSRSNGPIAGDA